MRTTLRVIGLMDKTRPRWTTGSLSGPRRAGTWDRGFRGFGRSPHIGLGLAVACALRNCWLRRLKGVNNFGRLRQNCGAVVRLLPAGTAGAAILTQSPE